MSINWLKDTLRLYAQFRKKHPELSSIQKRASALKVPHNFLWRLERDPNRNVGVNGLNALYNSLKKDLK